MLVVLPYYTSVIVDLWLLRFLDGDYDRSRFYQVMLVCQQGRF